MKGKKGLSMVLAVTLAFTMMPVGSAQAKGQGASPGEAWIEDGASPINVDSADSVLMREQESRGAEDSESDYDYVENEDGGVTISGYRGSGGDIVVPSELGGKSVTSIGDYAFSYCSGLTSVTIPEGVTSIGGSAFGGCSELIVMNVDEGNESYCSEDGVLYNKDKSALVCCPGGKKGAFTIPGGVTSIGYSAFEGCSGLTSVEIPEGVTYIGLYTFSGCSSLKSLTIPEGVTFIGDYAFSGCSELTSVEIPGRVTSIGYNAFSGCSGLTAINVDEGNESYCSEDGVLYKKDKSELVCCPGGKKGDFTIPGSVTSIGDYAFCNCSGLTSVTIPDGVESIGGHAFYGCNGLTSVTIPGSVKSMGEDVFYECDNLTLSVIKGSSAESYAQACDITYIYSEETPSQSPSGNLNGSGTGESNGSGNAGGNSNASGSGTTTPPTSGSNPGGAATPSGGASSTNQNQNAIPKQGASLKSDQTTYQVTKSGSSNGTVAFAKVSGNPSKVTVPSTVKINGIRYKVTSIASNAFKNNKKLTTVKIGSNVATIGANAFLGCPKLKSVTLGKNVATIGQKAFYQCKKLAKITIPSKVKKIGKQAFAGCKNLKNITIKTTKLTKKNVGSKAFSGISGKAKIKVPKKKLSAYKKLLQDRGIGEKVKVTK